MEVFTFHSPIPGPQVSDIERFLASRSIMIAPFSQDAKVVCSTSTYLKEWAMHNTTTRMLIDRQILSYIKQVATGGPISDSDRELVSAIMCFARLGEIQIEPNMALYEYADRTSTADAGRDLNIFRYADNLDFSLWHSLFLQTISALPADQRFSAQAHKQSQGVNFQQELRLFNFCHPFVLRLALLERAGGSPVKKMIQYLDWMHDEYFFGAPGALFGNLFLSPSRERQMIKNVGSSDRSKRLSGIRNACWDITFVQQWLNYVKKQADTPYLWIACSNDRALVKACERIFVSTVSIKNANARFSKILKDDWGTESGSKIFEHYCRLQRKREIAHRPADQGLPPEYWKAARSALEAQI
jgi:hypothetical protein